MTVNSYSSNCCVTQRCFVVPRATRQLDAGRTGFEPMPDDGRVGADEVTTFNGEVIAYQAHLTCAAALG